MKRISSIIMALSASALLLVSCGMEPTAGEGKVSAIKLTVSGVDTKVSAITTGTINSFKISSYITGKWRVDQAAPSEPEHEAGVYVDPVGGKLSGILVSKTDDEWRIAGNEDYGNPSFSWISGVAMNFFAYAPVSMKGTLTINKAESGTTSIDANYPFEYSSLANTSDEVTSSNCDDLIFAYTQHTASFGTDPADTDHYGKLIDGSTDKFSLKFYHALAQVRFCVNPADFTDMKLVYIKLYGPKSTSDPTKYVGIASKGKCTFTGPSTFSDWTDLSNRYIYSQTFNGDTGVHFSSGVPNDNWSSSTYGTSPNVQTIYTCNGDALLVIPQSLTECVVEVCIKDAASHLQYLKGNLPPTGDTGPVVWKSGNYYTYKIGTTGSRDELSLNMTLVDWAERESYIPIN